MVSVSTGLSKRKRPDHEPSKRKQRDQRTSTRSPANYRAPHAARHPRPARLLCPSLTLFGAARIGDRKPDPATRNSESQQVITSVRERRRIDTSSRGPDQEHLGTFSSAGQEDSREVRRDDGTPNLARPDQLWGKVPGSCRGTEVSKESGQTRSATRANAPL